MTDRQIPAVTDQDVYITRSFDAPVHVIWKFWTDPAFLAQWFGPEGISVPVDSIELEPRVGGSWSLVMRDDAGDYPFTATITALEPSEYLEMRLQTDTSKGFFGNELLRVWFHDHGEKTRVTLHQSPFTAELRDLTEQGWQMSFDKLVALLG